MQKDKQRFIKHAHKTKDRVTRTQLRQGVISGVPEGQTVPSNIPAAPAHRVYDIAELVVPIRIPLIRYFKQWIRHNYILP
jgi:hypothetical protein